MHGPAISDHNKDAIFDPGQAGKGLRAWQLSRVSRRLWVYILLFSLFLRILKFSSTAIRNSFRNRFMLGMWRNDYVIHFSNIIFSLMEFFTKFYRCAKFDKNTLFYTRARLEKDSEHDNCPEYLGWFFVE